MEKKTDIDWKKPLTNKQLLFFVLAFVLVCGLMLGYIVGAYQVQQHWEEYDENLQSRIENECLCIERYLQNGTDISLGGFKWE